jgi:hypothetical protein
MSERTSNGGIRIVGKLNKGIYPITGATIEYRSAGPSDAVPATADRTRLELAGSRSEKVAYRKGADEVAFTISPENVRNLDGKVLWYRWTIAYDRGGSQKIEETEIHRTGADEAGLPRAADNLGPDASVALPGAPYR